MGHCVGANILPPANCSGTYIQLEAINWSFSVPFSSQVESFHLRSFRLVGLMFSGVLYVLYFEVIGFLFH